MSPPVRRLLLTLLLLALALPAARAEQVVISEIMYHPPTGKPAWIELQNLTATPFDIAEWRLRAESMDYEFPAFSAAAPQATFLKPFERIVVGATNAAALRALCQIPESVRIFGPWSGKLKHSGNHIVLRDKNGLTLCTVTHEDSGHWSPAADGAGHSLVLKNPDRAIDDWRNWTASPLPGGSPGTAPAPALPVPVASPELNATNGFTYVNLGDTWRYLDQQRDPGPQWREPAYDDNAWPQGPALLGFSAMPLPAPGIRTGLRKDGQLTYYFRTRFSYQGSLSGTSLSIDQILDDGAIYYLNGREIGRSRMAPGPVTATTVASEGVGTAVEEASIVTLANPPLVQGVNVLAVEVHQTGPTSSDVAFGARVKIAGPTQGGVVINEVLPGPAGKGFVEFFNPGTNTVNLKGHWLSSAATKLANFQISADLVLAPRAFASVGFAESGLTAAPALAVFLVAPDGKTVVNALALLAANTAALDGRSLGRNPAGGTNWFLFPEPTRDQPNQNPAALAAAIRLNELHFATRDSIDWIELINTSAAEVPLDGLFLASKRDFSDRVALTGTLAARALAASAVAFALKAQEVTIYLVNRANTVLDCHRFTAPRGDAWQAFPDGSGEWYSVVHPSRGQTNNPPRNRDVVINEIMFDRPLGQEEGQFIELFNRGNDGVDLSLWRFSEGVDFTFPKGTMLPAGGYLVIAANTNWLREAYGNIPLLGNFKGRLSHKGELLRLLDRFGNLVCEVDYHAGGDWPELAKGGGSSMELVNPWSDLRRSSAWRDSDESKKAPFKPYRYVSRYDELQPYGPPTDYRELHLHMVSDGHLVLKNIQLRQLGIPLVQTKGEDVAELLDNVAARTERAGPNLLDHGDRQSTNNSSFWGWLCQGNHAASYYTNGELHIISDGRGDNRANRVETDATGLKKGTTNLLTFEARWVSGSARLIAQTFDHSIANSFWITPPTNLGTPGKRNSTATDQPAPQLDNLRHSPAVPKSKDTIKITARVFSATPLASVQVFHRLDNANGNGVWTNKVMFDDGLSGGDATAGDGRFTAELPEYKGNGQIVQFYVVATAQNGLTQTIPRSGPAKPALLTIDDRTHPRDLRFMRFVVSQYDVEAVANGESPKFGFRYPRHSNHYMNMTFISNEEDIFYNAEVRNSGSPWTRGGDLGRGKWKLPHDRLFRSHVKFTFDNDPDGGARHHNRITRHLLYLLGHPASENEFVRLVVNGSGPMLREDTEPVDTDFMNRYLPNGARGELYRIDDEWWFKDNWERTMRDADWGYKGSDNPGRYRTEWMKRSVEDADDFTNLIQLFKVVTQNKYTQSEIDQFIDPEAVLKLTAARGYASDWDTFTQGRGKNAYFYRRADDGRFHFLHWDSDLAYGDPNANFYGGNGWFRAYVERPYNRRLLYAYVQELIRDHTVNSARMEAWLKAEDTAAPAAAINADFYRNWFKARVPAALRDMGNGAKVPFAFTTGPAKTLVATNDLVHLTGTAPYGILHLKVEGHKKATPTWTTDTTWTIPNLQLKPGETALTITGTDQWGKILSTTQAPLTRITAPMLPTKP